MVKKILLISSVLFGLLFSTMPPECFADAAAQLEQAETYKNNEQYEQAEAIYKTVVTDYGGSNYALEAQKNLAILYIDWGKGPQAQAAYERLITDFSSHPALPGALYQVANKYQILQRHEQAIELYQYIVDNCPESDRAVPAQMDVVISNLELGNDAEAEAATDKLIADFAVHPDLPEALYGVADKYQDTQRHEQAIELFQYLADTCPESNAALPAQMDVVMSNLELGNDAEAEAALDKLIADFAAHPGLPDVLYHLANEYQGRQKHEQARQIYQYIADNRPESDMAAQAQMDVVISNLELGNDAEAEAATDKLIADFAVHPGLPEALNEVASQYEERRRYEKARQLYQYIADNLPEEYVILSRGSLIMLDIGLGNEANAQAALDSLIADFSDNPLIARVIWDTAQVYRKLKKYEKANELYQHVINNWPESEHAILSRGGMIMVDIGLGNDANAQAAIDNLIADFNDHLGLPEVVFVIGEQYYNKAFIYKKEGLDTEARGCFEKALAIWESITELPPNAVYPAQAYLFSGECYCRLGQHQTAIGYYQKVVDDWPDYENRWYALFLIGCGYEQLRDSGDVEKSLAKARIQAAYEWVLLEYPDCPAAKAADNWLKCYVKSSQGDQK